MNIGRDSLTFSVRGEKGMSTGGLPDGFCRLAVGTIADGRLSA
jgi:hypothetical protein